MNVVELSISGTDGWTGTTTALQQSTSAKSANRST